MNNILYYIRNYLQHSDKKTLAGSSIFCAIMIFLNYFFHLDHLIGKNSLFPVKLLIWALVFSFAFGIPILLHRKLSKQPIALPLSFYGLFIFSVLLFSIKYSFRFPLPFPGGPDMNHFLRAVFFWPAYLIMLAGCLYIVRKFFIKEETAWGTRMMIRNWRPYLVMLLIMIPLVSLAASQPDFQAMYPKLKTIAPDGNTGAIPAWKAILFELSYGSDFLSIELFFRGFLVLGFARWLGKDAILPVAIFYCSIHFGKPLGECISSYFGGLLLGIIVYNTRTIWGGLLVHLGIAWMMEVAGAVVSR